MKNIAKTKRRLFLSIFTPLGLAKTSYQSTKKQTKNNCQYIQNSYRQFKHSLNLIQQRKKEIKIGKFEDFNNVLKAWGVPKDDIKRMQKTILVEIIVLCLLIIVLAYGLLLVPSTLTFIQVCLAMIACCFRILERAWKYHIFKKQMHIQFRDWMFQNY
jgi:Flp pilus assembly protein TadB